MWRAKVLSFYMQLKLSSYQFKTGCYIYKMFYVHLIKHKAITYSRYIKLKKKGIKHRTSENQQFTKENSKRGRKIQETIKHPENY